jgi:hypothetical protein
MAVEYSDRYTIEQEIAKEQETRARNAITDAVSLGGIQGGGMMYHALGQGTRAGDMYRGLGRMLTGEGEEQDPRLARQDALMAILDKHGQPKTYDEMVAIANDLRSGGFPDLADKAMQEAYDFKEANEEEEEDSLTTKESTMEMAAQFHQCAIDAGGWQLADMECKAAVKKTFVEMQRGTWEEAGMIEGAKQAAEAIQTAQTSIYLDSDAANDSLLSIQQSIDWLQTGIYSGTVGGGVKAFKTLLVSLGIIDETRSMEEEGFLRNSMKSVTDWIQKTKGSISDKEMDAFIAASPGLANTKAGNLLILETMKASADYYVRLEAEYNNWKTKADARSRADGIPVSEVEWRTHLEKWYRTGGKPKMPTSAQIKAALKPDSDDEEETSAYEVSIN